MHEGFGERVPQYSSSCGPKEKTDSSRENEPGPFAKKQIGDEDHLPLACKMRNFYVGTSTRMIYLVHVPVEKRGDLVGYRQVRRGSTVRYLAELPTTRENDYYSPEYLICLTCTQTAAHASTNVGVGQR